MDHQITVLDRSAMAATVLGTPVGDEIVLSVTGWSMMPLLFSRRSVVYLKRVGRYAPRKGDIVLFRRLDGSFVLHRVHKVEKSGFLTINGDAQIWTESILPIQVLATVTHFVRRTRDVSVDDFGYRLYSALWCPLRFLHPLGARFVYYWHRVPEKLFGKKS